MIKVSPKFYKYNPLKINDVKLPRVQRASCHCPCLFDEMLQHCEVPYLLHKVQSQRWVLHLVESCPVLWIKEKVHLRNHMICSVIAHMVNAHINFPIFLQKTVLIFRLNAGFQYYTARLISSCSGMTLVQQVIVLEKLFWERLENNILPWKLYCLYHIFINEDVANFEKCLCIMRNKYSWCSHCFIYCHMMRLTERLILRCMYSFNICNVIYSIYIIVLDQCFMHFLSEETSR